MNADTYVLITVRDVQYRIRWYYVYSWAIGRLSESRTQTYEWHKLAASDYEHGMILFNLGVKKFGRQFAWEQICRFMELPDGTQPMEVFMISEAAQS